MVDVSPQSVFVERLKSALTSSFETLLAEITQVFVESFPPGATHCKRCTDIRNRENHEGVWSDADGARPQMLTSVPEPPRETVKKDQQFPSDDDEDDEETNQASLRLLSDTEIQKVPELLLFAPVKEEEEDLLEDPSAEHLGASGDALTPTEREETTPSSGGALHLKNQCDDEEHLVVHQILTDSSSSEPDASPESRLASVLDCSVQLQRIKVLQKLVDGFPRFHACSYCSRLFTSRKKHRRHTRFHTGERPYGCTICSRSFVLRKTLRLHTDWHGRRPHGCSQCRMSFSSRKKLRLHWSVHDGESPFLCWRCGVSYKSLKRLSRHLSQQHLESRS